MSDEFNEVKNTKQEVFQNKTQETHDKNISQKNADFDGEEENFDGVQQQNSDEERKISLPDAVMKAYQDNISMIHRVYNNSILSESAHLVTENLKNTLGKTSKTSSLLGNLETTKNLFVGSITTQTDQFNAMYSSLIDGLTNLSQIYVPKVNSDWIQTIQSMQKGNSFSKVYENIRTVGESLRKAMESPVISWLKTFDWSMVFQNFDKPPEERIVSEQVIDFSLQEMYNSHWFPYVVWKEDWSLTSEILGVVSKTRASKNRIKQLDQVIFRYYSDKKVEKVKKTWRSKGLPEFLMRILHQSERAYKRREYGLTVIALATQWERIICEKANDQSEWKKQTTTKKYFHELTKANDYPEIFNSFYDDFIIYDCYKQEDNIPDVPGRHSAAHSFYNKYPSKKAALNAILFTDFLVSLESVLEGN